MIGIGYKLKYLREIKGLKQQDIASLLKVSRASVSKYESGVRKPDVYTIIKLSQYYNVPSDYIVGLTENSHLSSHSVQEESSAYNSLGEDLTKIISKIKEHNLDLLALESIIDHIIELKKK